MGHSTASGRSAPGMAQERLDFFIDRQHRRRYTAPMGHITEFGRELDAMNVGDKIVETTTRVAGAGINRRETVTTYTKKADGWHYNQTVNGAHLMSGNVDSSIDLAHDILLDARDEDITWRVRR